MSVKDYITAKRESLKKYMEDQEAKQFERARTKQLKEKLDRQSLEVDAEMARKEMSAIKKAEANKKVIQATKDYNRKVNPSRMQKFASGMSGVGSSLGSGIKGMNINSGSKSLSGSSFGSLGLSVPKSKGKTSKDMFSSLSGGSSSMGSFGLGSGIFGGPIRTKKAGKKVKRRHKKHKKSKGSGKTITVHIK